MALTDLAGEIVDSVLPDREGKYRFEEVDPREYSLQVRSREVGSEVVSVEVRPDQSTEVIWVLRKEDPGSNGGPGEPARFVAGTPTFEPLS